MSHRLGEVLLDRDTIAARVAELGARVAEDLGAELAREGASLDLPDRIVLAPVLTGAIVFFADLVRHMQVAMSMRLVSVSSYPGASTASKGAKMQSALPQDLGGRHVVIVDDIFDSGQTLSLLQRLIGEQGPASLRTCVLLRKDAPRSAVATVDYVGFDIPNRFVVGYGLDYDGHYRNLPDIMTLEPG